MATNDGGGDMDTADDSGAMFLSARSVSSGGVGATATTASTTTTAAAVATATTGVHLPAARSPMQEQARREFEAAWLAYYYGQRQGQQQVAQQMPQQGQPLQVPSVYAPPQASWGQHAQFSQPSTYQYPAHPSTGTRSTATQAPTRLVASAGPVLYDKLGPRAGEHGVSRTSAASIAPPRAVPARTQTFATTAWQTAHSIQNAASTASPRRPVSFSVSSPGNSAELVLQPRLRSVAQGGPAPQYIPAALRGSAVSAATVQANPSPAAQLAPLPANASASKNPYSTPALKTYVLEAFSECKSQHERAVVETWMKDKLMRLIAGGTIQDVDWTREPKPKMSHLMFEKYGSVFGPQEDNETAPAAPGKRKRTAVIVDTVSGKKKTKSSKKRLQLGAAEQTKRDMRSLRFVDHLGRKESPGRGKGKKKVVAWDQSLFTSTSTDLASRGWESAVVVGTSTTLEKPYLRLTSAPDPMTVRTLPTLKKAFELVRQRWAKGEVEYLWACEQLKSIRQDLRVQHIVSPFTVKVYETHARIALDQSDLDELNQCQTQLTELYASFRGKPEERKVCASEAEFTAYHFTRILSGLPKAVLDDKLVRFALAVERVVAWNDYFGFFKLRGSAPLLAGHILAAGDGRIRRRALPVMLRSYRPALPVECVERALAFETRAACLKFLEEELCVLQPGKLHVAIKESLEARASAALAAAEEVADV